MAITALKEGRVQACPLPHGQGGVSRPVRGCQLPREKELEVQGRGQMWTVPTPALLPGEGNAQGPGPLGMLWRRLGATNHPCYPSTLHTELRPRSCPRRQGGERAATWVRSQLPLVSCPRTRAPGPRCDLSLSPVQGSRRWRFWTSRLGTS